MLLAVSAEVVVVHVPAAWAAAVIGSNTGGTPEIIGDAGFLFDREDDAALAGLLEPLVCDPALRAQYGLRARARAEQFSWHTTWRRLREIIAPLTEGAKHRSDASSLSAPLPVARHGNSLV